MYFEQKTLVFELKNIGFLNKIPGFFKNNIKKEF